MRPLGGVAGAMRGVFSLNLPVSDTVRRDFRFDLSSALTGGLFNGSVVSFIFVVARTIGVSQLGISVLVAMSAVGAVLALPVSIAPPGGNGRRFMFVAWAVARVMPILLVVVSGPAPYMVFISMFLILSAVAMPFYAELMQHVYPREFRGQLMSLVRVGTGTATTIAALATAWLLGPGHVKYQTVFAVGAVFSLTALWIFSHITPARPAPRPRQSMRDTLGILKRDRSFARYQLWIFFVGAGTIMAGTLYPLLIVDKLHAGYGPFGVLSVLNTLGYLVSLFVWGRIVDRAGPVFSILLTGLCVLTLPTGMLLAPSAYWLAPIMFINGITTAGFEMSTYGAVMHYAGATPQEVPRYMALYSIFGGIRGLVFPFVATLILAGSHYTLALSTALLLMGVGTFKLWRVYVDESREKPVVLVPALSGVNAVD